MDKFKKFFNIEKDITIESTIENGHLLVLYKEKWYRLTHEKNPEKFYHYHTLRKIYGMKLCHEIGLTEVNRKYNENYYRMNKKAMCASAKKYYAKKKITKMSRS